jgi:phosphoribosylformimino-5-aminoimidazole carboxamide ribotide isomerase
MEIIPAIDLIDGKCVRLTEGDFAQKTIYNESPVEVAKQFEAAGIKRLHLVDLDGAKAGMVINWKVLESITRETALVVDFGGGIKTMEEVQKVFDTGARYATIGSIAVKNESLLLTWFEKYGADKFLVGADVKNEKLAIGGWLETTGVDIIDFISKYMGHGIRQLFCTDVSKDGKLEGPSLDLYRKIMQHFPQLHFIASGGVSSMDDLYALKEIGCKGAIVGKAIYENRITLSELTAMNKIT